MEFEILRREVSAATGLVGGLIDLFVGSSILQQNSMMMSSMIVNWPAQLVGYFLLVLGVIVLLTGVYLLVSKMMRKRSMIGWLMIIYGLIMLALGTGMIEQVFGSMMQWSSTSGIVMILVGLAMLYSGYDMTMGSKEKTM
jgi:uncharacterized membrane protein HdeD (DUF308 family)